MITLEKYVAKTATTSLENPTKDQVIEAMEALDGVDALGIRLKLPFQDVAISISEDSHRAHIRYSTLNDRRTLESSRVLIDITEHSNDETSFLLSNGQIDGIPLRESVDRQTALKIALYFLEHRDMPRGLFWQPPIRTS